MRIEETTADAGASLSTTNEAKGGGAAKPKGKAAKKRALANKLADAAIIFDNEEEELLFEVAFERARALFFVYKRACALFIGTKRADRILPISSSL